MSRRAARDRAAWRAGACLLGASLALAGCRPAKPPAVDFSTLPRNFRSEDYHAVYDRWTRHDKVMYGVDLAIEAWATFKSWEYRDAFLAHYASVYDLAEPERDNLAASQREEDEGGYDFVLAVQTERYEWNDLERSGSAWRVSLIDGAGRSILPERIEAPRLPDAYSQEFFPDQTPFSRTYVVHFARQTADKTFRGDETGRLTLRIASPIGQADLTWSSR